uniref:Heat shock protein family A (Hsp70) member 12B n=1 Tax=Serinus canaria TaxID=9135 RepID=A0A8C9MF31_SERCA
MGSGPACQFWRVHQLPWLGKSLDTSFPESPHPHETPPPIARRHPSPQRPPVPQDPPHCQKPHSQRSSHSQRFPILTPPFPEIPISPSPNPGHFFLLSHKPPSRVPLLPSWPPPRVPGATPGTVPPGHLQGLAPRGWDPGLYWDSPSLPSWDQAPELGCAGVPNILGKVSFSPGKRSPVSPRLLPPRGWVSRGGSLRTASVSLSPSPGDRYIVADCGGGTVDLTVHQIEKPQGTLKELYKASGGPYGAVGVDLAFEKLLCRIFGDDFIATFKAKRPAAWVDLTIAFEARKRAAAPSRSSPLNISLPFSFVDFYRKHRGHNVETALRKSNVNLVKWSSQGMLRMSPEVMNELFQPTITHIIQHIDALLKKPEVHGIKFLFLVGGFAESAMLQGAVQAAFGRCCRVIVPQDVGLTILKGAVLFGLDPGVVRVRRSPLTYGVGVLNKFVEGKHPREKLLVKEGKNWCTDIFEKFVAVDQSVALGEVVQRSYCPARPGQRRTIINIYCCDTDDVVYITDPGVRKCGTI